LSEKLTEFLKTGKDWSRLATTVPGVFVLKLPSYRGSTLWTRRENLRRDVD